METAWDAGMRLSYLRSKLDLAELVKLDQIVQLMEDQGYRRPGKPFERGLYRFFREY